MDDGTVTLSASQLKYWRKCIRVQLSSVDKEHARSYYASLLAMNSHPFAVWRGRVVKGTRRLQYLLNAIIWWWRLQWLLIFALLVIAWRYSWWLLIGVPCLLLLRFVVNAVQTFANVELAARLHALDTRMDRDEHFREEVLKRAERNFSPQDPTTV